MVATEARWANGSKAEEEWPSSESEFESRETTEVEEEATEGKS
jgi:hypothetical protein